MATRLLARTPRLRVALGALLLAACDTHVATQPGPDASLPLADAAASDGAAPDGALLPDGAVQLGGPVTPVSPGLPRDPAERFDALRQAADRASALDAAGAQAAYPTRFRPGLGYDPGSAQFLDRIQASALSLSPAELDKLGTSGFVISTRREFPTMVHGLAQLYSEHLPLYVSADALLEAVHRSYDAVLRDVEIYALAPAVRALLLGMRERIGSLDVSATARADADLYLSVALGLISSGPQLDGPTTPPPLTGGFADAGKVSELVSFAEAAQGIAQVSLFDSTRVEDFSQFKPRGHYDHFLLQSYFRAMMWLGRVDLRLIETQSDGSQQFRRGQYEAMLALHALAAPDLARFRTIDDAIRAFVGESDNMVLSEVDRLVSDLGGPAAARTASDDAVVKAVVDGGYGMQQIASYIIVNATAHELPLNRSFALFGQRYVVDSHVFSEVVYDRLPAKRMMPDPLDAAFAALGNNQALALDPDVAEFSALPGALARMRVLVDGHDPDFWQKNLYNRWLTALRALSPAADLTSVPGLPAVAATEAWGRRMLNTQLGSWAELRHDTLLYAKQSYTGVPLCGYPDAYVDPYPAFYAALAELGRAGDALAAIELMGSVAPVAHSFFQSLASTAERLRDMAERELRGEPFSAEQLAFINDAVRIERQSAGCTTIDVPDGWYADLFYERRASIEFDPTIADVHTQPADEGGATVGRVLHVGTGYPRLMVTTVDTCEGPRAYAGVVYAYHELVTQNFERRTDEEWSTALSNGPRPSDVPWLVPVLAR